MEKKILLLPQKLIFLFGFSLVFLNSNTYSQCVTANPLQEYCAIDNKTVADLEVITGINVVWYDSLSGGNQYNASTLLVSGNSYFAVDTDSSCTDTTRLEVTVLLNGEPPENVNVFVGKCASEKPTISDLAADGTAIEWYNEQFDGTLLPPTTSLENGKTYWVQQTENGCTSERLPTTISLVDPITPTVDSEQYFCSLPTPTVADLKSVETNIVWYNSETSTTPLGSTTALIDGEDYWATQLNFPCESTIRVQTTVTISTALNAGTDGSYTKCELNATTTNLFTLLGGTPDNTGTWTGPSTLSGDYLGTFDPSVNTEGIYTYTVSSDSAICANESATVEVTILKVEPPTSDVTQTFCEIDNPTIADLTVNGTNIRWYDTETSATPLNPTDALIDGKDYWATQTEASGCESMVRLKVTASVTSPLAPTTPNTTQIFCNIDNPTVANLYAAGTSLLWYESETSTTPLNLTDALIDGEDYWASQTEASGCESNLRLVINVLITTQLPPTTIEDEQTFCEIDTPTISDLNVSGNNIQWYDTETSTTPLNSTDALIDGEDYWATQSNDSSCESNLRLVVKVNITTLSAPTTSATNQSFCMSDYTQSAPTISNIDVNGTNVVWYISKESTTPLNSTDELIDGQTYWATQTEASGCESATRLTVNVTIIDTPKATTTETIQTFCEVNNATISDLSITGDTILWFDTETSTNALSSTEALIDDEDYWALNTDTTTGCHSVERLQITVVITAVSPPIITEKTQSFCEEFNPTVAELEPSTSTLWYASETENTPFNSSDLLVNNSIYWASTVNSSGCISSTREAVTVVLNDPGTPILTSNNEFCKIDNPTLYDLNDRVSPVNEGIIAWYTEYPNGNALNLSEPLDHNETYYAVETGTNGCSSVNPLEVTVNLEICEEYDVIIYDGFSPNGDGVNDTFKIENLRELYPDFRVQFFNRWGNLIYTADAENNDWNGKLKGNGEIVPSGVYYFVINFNKNNREPLQDRLYLSN